MVNFIQCIQLSPLPHNPCHLHPPTSDAQRPPCPRHSLWPQVTRLMVFRQSLDIFWRYYDLYCAFLSPVQMLFIPVWLPHSSRHISVEVDLLCPPTRCGRSQPRLKHTPSYGPPFLLNPTIPKVGNRSKKEEKEKKC